MDMFLPGITPKFAWEFRQYCHEIIKSLSKIRLVTKVTID